MSALSCPFCGVIPEITKPIFGERIVHPENGCFLAKRRPGDLGEAWLLEDWNRRPVVSVGVPVNRADLQCPVSA